MIINSYSLCIVALLIALTFSQGYPTFDEYLHDFQKSYSSEQQKGWRKSIYEERIATFAPITEYTPGVNNFTDWTQEEINSLKNLKSKSKISTTNEEIMQDTSYLSVSSPSSLDWRDSKVVTSVKTQDTCGACWAFAVTAYIESKLIIQKGYGQNVDLSQQYLVSCTPGSDCTGGYLDDAIYVAATGGLPFESSYPYNPSGYVSQTICSTKNKVTDAGKKYRILRNLSDSTIIRLLQNGPLAIAISADNWESYRTGIFSCPNGAALNHAVLLVGYTPNYWIVKNQWGRSWGESGYIRITRNQNTNYANCYIGNRVVYIDPNPSQSNFSISLRYFGVLFVLIIVLLL